MMCHQPAKLNLIFRHRGYYMAARRSEISLRALSKISQVSAVNEWNILQHEKRNFVSPRSHAMFYLLYRLRWNTKAFHFNNCFPQKARFIMSPCQRWSFHLWRYQVFAQKLNWYFTVVYIIDWFHSWAGSIHLPTIPTTNNFPMNNKNDVTLLTAATLSMRGNLQYAESKQLSLNFAIILRALFQLTLPFNGLHFRC